MAARRRKARSSLKKRYGKPSDIDLEDNLKAVTKLLRKMHISEMSASARKALKAAMTHLKAARADIEQTAAEEWLRAR